MDSVLDVIQLGWLVVYTPYVIWFAVMLFRSDRNGYRFDPRDYSILGWILLLGGIGLGLITWVNWE